MTATSNETRSLGDAAYQRLRDEIVSCRLQPGQRLTERSLADSTGFGMSPIRDALTRLDHEGLVRTLPRKGYQVTPLTLKSVDDLFTLWRIVAPEIARLGLRDAGAAEHKLLVSVFGELAELGHQADTGERIVKLSAEAFGILAAATRNEYLLTICARLQNDLARIWVLTAQAETPVPALGVDERWVRIVERRDGDAAADAVRLTLGEMHSRALGIFSRWPSVAASEITPLRS